MRQRIVPALICACLGLAACGGSSGSSATTGSVKNVAPLKASPATRAAFVTQVNSVCTRADNAYLAATNAKARVAVIQHYVAVFRSVTAPKQLQSLYARYVSVLAQELADLKRGDSAGLAKLRDTQARPLARKLGATACIT